MKLTNQSFTTFLVRIAALLIIGLGTAQANVLLPAPPQVAAKSYLLIDAQSGKVIDEHNADLRLSPASLTKMMTSYIAANELHRGNMALDDQVRISIKAWKTPGSRMFIKEGDTVALEDLLRGIVIQSGNDASVAVAEYIAGGEDAFADLMNQHALRLGMENTQFQNATGLPAKDHYSSARDLALLAKAIINDHPEHYKTYAEKYFTYNKIRQPNRNKLLWRDDSVDGIKTGHTEAAGYCLVSSAQRNGMRLIAVVMGAKSVEARASESQKLLTYGFRYFETNKLYDAAQQLNETRLWGGAKETVSLGIQDELFLTLPRGQAAKLVPEIEVHSYIEAPITAGQAYGTVKLTLDDQVVVEKPLVALETVEPGGFFERLWDMIVLFFYQLIAGDS